MPREKKKTATTTSPSFYSRVMEEAERIDLQLASGVDGVDEEIALLRVQIKSLVGDDPGKYA